MSADWISAPEAFKRVSAVLDPSTTPHAICSRAWAGLIEAKALMFVGSEGIAKDAVIPARFWWAQGGPDLVQDWSIGDFITMVSIPGGQAQWWAYGVSFSRRGVQGLIDPHVSSATSENVVRIGGRPPAAWWDDLWVDIARRLFVGDLKPKRQADIENAMMDWVAANGHETVVSTIRPRARKLWSAIEEEDKN